MYTIWIDGKTKPLHNNFFQEQGNICFNPIVETQVNAHGSVTFDVIPDNPQYSDLHRLSTYITVKDNSDEIWRGRVLSCSRGTNNVKHVYCEGELGYLCDTIKRPEIYKCTVEEFFTALITNHNSQLPSGDKRRFAKGTVTVTGNVEADVSAAATTWDTIGRQLLQTFGGYIRTRKSGATVYLDYLADFTVENSQDVKYGSNMIDFSEEIDASAVVTRLIPYGARKTHAARLYKQSGSSNNFYLHTGDVVAGKYLFVVNGCALSAEPIQSGGQNTGKLQAKLVTFSGDHITTPASGDVVWSVSASNIDMSEDVSVSGSTASSMTFTGTYVDENDNEQQSTATVQQTATFSGQFAKVGGAVDGSTKGTVTVQKGGTQGQQIRIGDNTLTINFNQATTSVSVASNATQKTEWLIRNTSTSEYLAAESAEGRLSTIATAGRLSVWKISNTETGTTISNVQKANDKELSTLFGDVDDGFWLAQSTSAQRNMDGSENDADRLTIAKANSGSDVVISTTGETLWGLRVWGTQIFEDASTPTDLLNAATNALISKIAERLSIETTAADLSLLYPETMRFSDGEYSHIKSWLHGIDDLRMLCTHVVRYLDEPEKTTVTFGVGRKTLTDLQGGLIADVS